MLPDHLFACTARLHPQGHAGADRRVHLARPYNAITLLLRCYPEGLVALPRFALSARPAAVTCLACLVGRA